MKLKKNFSPCRSNFSGIYSLSGQMMSILTWLCWALENDFIIQQCTFNCTSTSNWQNYAKETSSLAKRPFLFLLKFLVPKFKYRWNTIVNNDRDDLFIDSGICCEGRSCRSDGSLVSEKLTLPQKRTVLIAVDIACG